MQKITAVLTISMVFLVGSTYQRAIARGGVSTGEAKTYASVRTAGITDANAPKIFEDVT